VVDPVGAALEIVGVAIVAGGTLISLAAMAWRWLRHGGPDRSGLDTTPRTDERDSGACENNQSSRRSSSSGHEYRSHRDSSGDARNLYVAGRRSVGRSILLGIEVLVAGDIIRTVAVSPSFTSVGVLAGIVAIRTFLSFTLEVEITGQWPWQQKPRDSASGEI
jgi:hypothetical protein